MLDRVSQNTEKFHLHKNFISFLKKKWNKTKSQENYTISVAFLVFICGIICGYFFWNVAFLLCLLPLFWFAKLHFVLFVVGFVAMKIDFVNHNQKMVEKPIYNAKFQGTVENFFPHKNGGLKIELSNVTIEDYEKLMLYCKFCENITLNSVLKVA